ncbi:hypothetical protein [Nitrososphaera sp. AFS]|uniref:hypothetical protein n=1 Tax=Nitrososphaera sp. AFS TaxID=2301191 RepID=UPI0013922635|nr:hypothetical protein [Nitrososphaera sp. AFS]
MSASAIHTFTMYFGFSNEKSNTLFQFLDKEEVKERMNKNHPSVIKQVPPEDSTLWRKL